MGDPGGGCRRGHPVCRAAAGLPPPLLTPRHPSSVAETRRMEVQRRGLDALPEQGPGAALNGTPASRPPSPDPSVEQAGALRGERTLRPRRPPPPPRRTCVSMLSRRRRVEQKRTLRFQSRPRQPPVRCLSPWAPAGCRGCGVASWEGCSRARRGPGSPSDREERSIPGGSRWGCAFPLGGAPRSGAACEPVGAFQPAQSRARAPQESPCGGGAEGRRSAEPPQAGWAPSFSMFPGPVLAERRHAIQWGCCYGDRVPPRSGGSPRSSPCPTTRLRENAITLTPPEGPSVGPGHRSVCPYRPQTPRPTPLPPPLLPRTRQAKPLHAPRGVEQSWFQGILCSSQLRQ